MAGVGQTSSHIRHWYQNQVKGTSNGIPVAYVAVNKEPGSTFQGQTDTFLRATNVNVCGNDYTSTTLHGVRNLFAPPTGLTNNPRPVFVAINCVSNSPSHAYRQVLLNAPFDGQGGGAFNFATTVTNVWRPILDSVQAPPPRLTNARLTGGAFEFTFPGQRGRTNRVECTTNLPPDTNWVTVTNVFGTNAPITVRDTNAAAGPRRFYRVRRL
jgi:hypothetical protein